MPPIQARLLYGAHPIRQIGMHLHWLCSRNTMQPAAGISLKHYQGLSIRDNCAPPAFGTFPHLLFEYTFNRANIRLPPTLQDGVQGQ